MFLALDTDILMYKAATAAEREIDWSGDIWSLYTDLAEAKAAFQTQIDRITNKLDVHDYVCCLSDLTGNFRKQVDPEYKSGRRGTRKPIGYRHLYDWIEQEFRSFSKPLLEADDCMGILATKPSNVGKCIIVSDDKDLKTIPGRLYRPFQDEHLNISEQDADAFFYQQCLQGDPTDSIKGLKGVGEKTALKILGSRPAWSSVEQAYVKAGLTRDDAIQQARLVRILRWSEWDDKKKEIKLWQPNT